MSDHPQNRLKDSASPYLRSAAHQPIDWHEWGDDVFARAKSEDKPILLDIGAVWCHWCHVIDRESYENPEIAAIINDHFVPVKVDRDERPDVDSRYQSAISAISGQGGWPLTGFLLPDGKPFFGGTYFPPDDKWGGPVSAASARPLPTLIKNKRADVERAANSLADAVAKAEVFTGARGAFDPEVVNAQIAIDHAAIRYQKRRLRARPEISAFVARSILSSSATSRRKKSICSLSPRPRSTKWRAAEFTINSRADFIAIRSTSDGCVPHFEKMSYDNSELLRNYLHGCQVTLNPSCCETAEGIIGWVNEMLSDQAEGGFYASQDADHTLDDDGDYFTWTLEELRAVLPPVQTRVMELYYDVEARGEMHHNPEKNVLWITRDAREIAKTLNLEESSVRASRSLAQKGRCSRRASSARHPISTRRCTSVGMRCSSRRISTRRRVFEGALSSDCRKFALKTLDRMLREAWGESRRL